MMIFPTSIKLIGARSRSKHSLRLFLERLCELPFLHVSPWVKFVPQDTKTPFVRVSYQIFYNLSSIIPCSDMRIEFSDGWHCVGERLSMLIVSDNWLAVSMFWVLDADGGLAWSLIRSRKFRMAAYDWSEDVMDFASGGSKIWAPDGGLENSTAHGMTCSGSVSETTVG